MTTGTIAGDQRRRRQCLAGALAVYERMVEIRFVEERIQADSLPAGAR